jgi:hypothetical protein
MIRIIGAVVLAALISTFLAPGLGVNSTTLATYLGFLVALVVVLITFEVPGLVLRRRRTGELGRLRPLPWALGIAALFVVVSRIAALQPGYLYGIVLGIVFMREVGEKDEGREEAAGAIWTLAVAVGAWLVLGWFRDQAPAIGAFGTTLATTTLSAITVAGMEAVAFGLMPFRFMPGWVVYRWNRLGWAILFGLSVFAFVHILIGPNTGYLSSLSIPGLLAALGVFLAFSVFSVLFWAYFRFRPARATEEGSPAGGAAE